MREKVKSIGLILAIAIAGISLPTRIISFMNKPTQITEINNYYYNNTTTILNNTIPEPELVIYPLERDEFYINMDDSVYLTWNI